MRYGQGYISYLGIFFCVYGDLGRYDEAEQLYLKGIPAARHKNS